jgi:hypothetical protein
MKTARVTTALTSLAAVLTLAAFGCEGTAIVHEKADLDDLAWDACGRNATADTCDGACAMYYWPPSTNFDHSWNPKGYPNADRPIGCFGPEASCSADTDCNPAQRCVHVGFFEAAGTAGDTDLCWPTYVAAQAQLAAQE